MASSITRSNHDFAPQSSDNDFVIVLLQEKEPFHGHLRLVILDCWLVSNVERNYAKTE